MTTHSWLIPRRTVLRGIGAALALPLLETMGWAETPKGGKSYKPPVRLCFINVPHGVNQDEWWPKDGQLSQSGALPSSLEPLRPHLGDLLILDRLNQAAARGDADGTHAREAGTWLTGTAIKRDAVETGISADQIAAQRIGQYTVLPSLELGTAATKAAGDCTKGYSCAYFNLSWRASGQPMPREINPKAVFDRLFSSRRATPARRGGPAVDAAQFAGKVNTTDDGKSLDQSMLDIVFADSKALRDQVSRNDQRKMDEYLDGVRSLEKRIQAIEAQAQEAAASKEDRKGFKSSPLIEVKIPGSIPTKFDDHVKLMFDLITMAFQSDTTRVVTFLMANMFVSRSYPEIGISEGHHDLSHHFKKPDMLAKLAKIDKFHNELFASFIARLKSLVEGRGTLLDNCIIVYGSGLGDGYTHSPDRLPTIVAGTGGGTIRSGRYVKQAGGNFADLLMGVMARAGAPVERHGDGTKMLPDLS
jgi:hypothetical protein